ncbi:unnamed protein product, partial [Hydatigera taeniaeformis]|uniref:Amino acid transporter n=1 Tax=Hydatigena taeniaeformis TaxID=6205 RepID=A0A0R3XCE1_HYDTA
MPESEGLTCGAENCTIPFQLTKHTEHMVRPGWRRKCLKFGVDNWFMITTVVGVIVGLGVGFALQKANLSEQGRVWLNLPGRLYIRILQLTILPMIVANIITGGRLFVVSELNPRTNKKLSGVTIAYIFASNIISSLIGLTYALLIRPGASHSTSESRAPSTKEATKISYIFQDLLLNIFPNNLITLTLSQAGTDFDHPRVNSRNETYYISISVPGTNMIGKLIFTATNLATPLFSLVEYSFQRVKTLFSWVIQVLTLSFSLSSIWFPGVLFCSVAFGLAINGAKEKGLPFKDFFASLGDIVMLLMQKFLLMTPICVMFMVMSAISSVDNLQDTFRSLGLFVALNFVGQFTHLIYVILSLLCLCKNPFGILRLSLPP